MSSNVVADGQDDGGGRETTKQWEPSSVALGRRQLYASEGFGRKRTGESMVRAPKKDIGQYSLKCGPVFRVANL
jgi:hypothetical protein